MVSEKEADERGQSETEWAGALNDDSYRTLVVICSTLLLLLASSIASLYIWKGEEGLNLGGPPSALLSWDLEYKQMTGFDRISGLEGIGVIVCVVDSGIDLNHPDLDHIQLLDWRAL